MAWLISGYFVHGRWKEPIEVVDHEGQHFKKSRGTDKKFYHEWEKKRDSVSVERGQNVELAYHILAREILAKIIIGLEGVKREKMTFVNHPKDIEDNITEGIKTFIFQHSKMKED